MTTEEMLKSRRVKILRVNRSLFPGLFSQGKDGLMFQIKGLPADAQFIAITEHAYFLQDQWAFRVWSSEFPIVEDGCCGELELKVTRITPSFEVESIKGV